MPERTAVPSLVIREALAFRVLATGEGFVVEGRRPGPATAQALARLFALHASPAHPAVARAVALDEDGNRVTFDFPAVMDFAQFLRTAGARGMRATHGEADGFIVTLRDALRASAKVSAPDGTRGLLGTLTYGNVLFARDGRFALLGLGHNVVACDEHGTLTYSEQLFQASEITVGGAPSESADFVALLKMVRSLMAFVRLEPALARALAGNSLAEDAELVARLLWIERRCTSAAPDARASIAEIIRVSDRIRALLGVWPDPEAFARRARAVLTGEETQAGPPPLTVALDGASFSRPSGERVELAHRPRLARLLAALARARREDAERALDVRALREAGWPGERMGERSAANRVYVAINALRRAGLGPDLERHGGGYRLRPATPIELVAARAPTRVAAPE